MNRVVSQKRLLDKLQVPLTSLKKGKLFWNKNLYFFDDFNIYVSYLLELGVFPIWNKVHPRHKTSLLKPLLEKKFKTKNHPLPFPGGEPTNLKNTVFLRGKLPTIRDNPLVQVEEFRETLPEVENQSSLVWIITRDRPLSAVLDVSPST